MGDKIFKLTRIEGEYAYLRPTDGGEEDEIFVAMFLLPLGADVGSLLKMENFEFSLI